MRKYLNVKLNLYFVYFYIVLLYMELVMRKFLQLRGNVDFVLWFSIPAAVLFGAICHGLPGKAGKIASFVLTGFLIILYGVQMVYHHIYGSFASISQIGMTKDVMNTFGGAAMIGIQESLGALCLLLVPLVVLALLTVFKLVMTLDKFYWQYPVILGVVFFALHFGVVLLLPLGGTYSYSALDIYKHHFVLDKSERKFGVLVTFRMELKTLLFGMEELEIEEVDIPEVVIVNPTPEAGLEESAQQPTETTQDEEVQEPQEIPISYAEQILDIDFDALAESTDNEELQQLDYYFGSVKPTHKNAYTGMFEGYNLIVLCCESYTPFMLSPELTPTLYKLSQEGFVFKNFYNTICDNTSNSEYTLNMSLLPDVSLYSDGSDGAFNTFTFSKDNDVPFCFGNLMKGQGYRAYAFHNFAGTYYKRDETHVNMGYDFKYMSHGLKYEKACPTSDKNMVTQAADYLYERDENGEITPFMAYFLTFSGHMPYRFSPSEHWFTGNDMAIKNQEAVEDLPYSDKTKAFLAAQLELEYAVTELLENLEEEGIADRTLIVLTGDHYPYSLGLDGLEEIVGHDLDPEFDKFRGSFILWTAGMEETVEVDTPCCTLDIMPTVYNLLGIDYDSRLLMGTDIFADGDHAAILMDRSFITEYVTYDANSEEARVLEGVELPETYIDAWNTFIKDKFVISKMVLYNDYYRHLGLEE